LRWQLCRGGAVSQSSEYQASVPGAPTSALARSASARTGSLWKVVAARAHVPPERSRDAASALTGGKHLPPHRTAALRDLVDPRSGETLDRGLLVCFEAPRSFTGEHVAELHVHGGRTSPRQPPFPRPPISKPPPPGIQLS